MSNRDVVEVPTNRTVTVNLVQVHPDGGLPAHRPHEGGNNTGSPASSSPTPAAQSNSGPGSANISRSREATASPDGGDAGSPPATGRSAHGPHPGLPATRTPTPPPRRPPESPRTSPNPGAAPFDRAADDHQRRAVRAAGEIIRRVPPRPIVRRPEQPEGLRADAHHRRIEAQQHQLVVLQPGFVPDVPADGGGPPQARQVALISIRGEGTCRSDLRERHRPRLRQGTP